MQQPDSSSMVIKVSDNRFLLQEHEEVWNESIEAKVIEVLQIDCTNAVLRTKICSQLKEGESSANQEEVNKALKTLHEQGKVTDPGAKTGVMLTAGVDAKNQSAEDTVRDTLSKAPTTPMKAKAIADESPLPSLDAVAALGRMRDKKEVVEVSGNRLLLQEHEAPWQESIQVKIVEVLQVDSTKAVLRRDIFSKLKDGEPGANTDEVNQALKTLHLEGTVTDPEARTGVMLTAGVAEKSQSAEKSLRDALSKAPITPRMILALTSEAKLSQSDAAAAFTRMRSKQEIVEVSGKRFLLQEHEAPWREAIETKIVEVLQVDSTTPVTRKEMLSKFNKDSELSASAGEVDEALKTLHLQRTVSDPEAGTGVMLTAGIQEKDQRAEDSLRAALSKAPTTPMKLLALTSVSELSQSDAAAALKRLCDKQEVVDLSSKRGYLLAESVSARSSSLRQKTLEVLKLQLQISTPVLIKMLSQEIVHADTNRSSENWDYTELKETLNSLVQDREAFPHMSGWVLELPKRAHEKRQEEILDKLAGSSGPKTKEHIQTMLGGQYPTLQKDLKKLVKSEKIAELECEALSGKTKWYSLPNLADEARGWLVAQTELFLKLEEQSREAKKTQIVHELKKQEGVVKFNDLMENLKGVVNKTELRCLLELLTTNHDQGCQGCDQPCQFQGGYILCENSKKIQAEKQQSVADFVQRRASVLEFLKGKEEKAQTLDEIFKHATSDAPRDKQLRDKIGKDIRMMLKEASPRIVAFGPEKSPKRSFALAEHEIRARENHFKQLREMSGHRKRVRLTPEQVRHCLNRNRCVRKQIRDR